MADINKDVRSISTERNQTTGCDCKVLKVDKLSIVRMKQELRNLGESLANVDKWSKNELTIKLKESLKNCSLCVENNCACVLNEVACHADICGCLVRQSVNQGCKNPYGKFVFDAHLVSTHRENVFKNITSLAI